MALELEMKIFGFLNGLNVSFFPMFITFGFKSNTTMQEGLFKVAVLYYVPTRGLTQPHHLEFWAFQELCSSFSFEGFDIAFAQVANI